VTRAAPRRVQPQALRAILAVAAAALDELETGPRRSGAVAVEGLTVPSDGHRLPETRLSDHSAFGDAGGPAVIITDTAIFRDPNDHRPTDRAETLDADFMARSVTGLTEAVTGLAERGP